MTESWRLERAPRPSLARHVETVWIERSGITDPLLPDAAVELVWSGRGLFVRGADTRPHAVSGFPDRTFVAVRFRPGAAAGLLGFGGRELADARVGVSELWGHAEMERIESELRRATPPQAAVLLEDVVESRAHELPDPVVEAAVRALSARGTAVSQLAERIGLSERHLLRRCVGALGYGPKTLERILRFQRFLTLGRSSRLALVELAAEAGYADQPHLTRECRRLSGATPAALLGRSWEARPFRSRHRVARGVACRA